MESEISFSLGATCARTCADSKASVGVYESLKATCTRMRELEVHIYGQRANRDSNINPCFSS